MTKKSIKEVQYGSNSLQKGGRIKLPQPLLNTLSIKEGQQIDILLDTENVQIILRAVDAQTKILKHRKDTA